ncbi:MAG: LysR family transcriptional regulator [Chloroflexi bacterium]|nr:LysR family transcriptional regulator [Chloroflexota bacterium]
MPDPGPFYPNLPADGLPPVPFPFHAHQLAYLREVERSPTFTVAAERLGVSQPALSQALATMERHLAIPLFERDGRRRVLTEAGVEVARFASEVLGRATELRSWIAARQQGEAGTLAVGMIDAASLYLLPGTIGAFREAHPDVDLRLLVDTSEALMDRLRRFELDLAFVIAPAGADLEAVPVRTELLHLYAPAAVPARTDEVEWALYPAGSHTRLLIDEGLRRLGMTPRVMLESCGRSWRWAWAGACCRPPSRKKTWPPGAPREGSRWRSARCWASVAPVLGRTRECRPSCASRWRCRHRMPGGPSRIRLPLSWGDTQTPPAGRRRRCLLRYGEDGARSAPRSYRS